MLPVLLCTFPFPIVRHVLEYVPNLPSMTSSMTLFFQKHYGKRVCEKCGEFFKCNPDRKDRSNKVRPKCLCRSRYRCRRYMEDSHLTVSIRPIIICILDQPKKLEYTGMINSMAADVFQFIDDIYSDAHISHRTEHFVFIIHRQPKRVVRFRKALRFLEKCQQWNPRKPPIRLYPFIRTFMAMNMTESVVNMSTEALAVSDASGHLYDAHTFLSSLCASSSSSSSLPASPNEDECFLSSRLRYTTYGITGTPLRLPFILPVSYLYPHHEYIHDLPTDCRSRVLAMYHHEMQTKSSHSIPYDPLHLLMETSKRSKSCHHPFVRNK